MQIRRSGQPDLAQMSAVINDAAQAYRGVIPADRWHEPYMPEDELARLILTAGGGNYAWVANWHNDGANATFFDGHVKWMKFNALTTPPAQYQSNLRQWRLWYPYN